MSEVNPWWTLERQREALADVLPSAQVFCDRLVKKDRRSHRPEYMTEREAMLRPTTRAMNETIFVASYAVLAMTADDLQRVRASASTRGAKLVSIDEPGQPCTVEVWLAAKRKSRLEGAARRGAAISAARRRVRAEEGCKRIEDDWPKPSQEYSTKVLLARAGEPGEPLSYNTVVARLGGREKAQIAYQRKLSKRKTA